MRPGAGGDWGRSSGGRPEPSPILVLTGPVHSGKTTQLLRWIERAREEGALVEGIVAPLVEGKRHLCLIGTDECAPLEASDQTPDESRVRIGPHLFDDKVFALGRDHLATIAHTRRRRSDTRHQWIVVDEVGPLELQGKGLEPAVGTVLGKAIAAASSRGHGPSALIVVREGLVDRVLEHYSIPSKLTTTVGRDELSSVRPSS